MSEFAAWRGEAQARWSLDGERSGGAHVPATEPLRALRKLRRQIPKAIRPRRTRMYRLCWEAVYLYNQHDMWVTRPIDWLHPQSCLTVDGVPVMLEISIRIHHR
jgi:hypothetical protein